jgi:hypothetical protein
LCLLLPHPWLPLPWLLLLFLRLLLLLSAAAALVIGEQKAWYSSLVLFHVPCQHLSKIFLHHIKNILVGCKEEVSRLVKNHSQICS